jgi:hypothetical protein
MPAPLDPASFANAILLEASDIPAHMTLAEWRLERRSETRRQRRRRRVVWFLRRRRAR